VDRKRLIIPLFVLATAALAARPPVKLGLEAPSVDPSGQIKFRVVLLDAANQPATAPKPLKVALWAGPANNKKSLGSVEIAAGQSSVEASVRTTETGLVYLWAKNPEMLIGGAFVQVRGRPPMPTQTPPPSPRRVPPLPAERPAIVPAPRPGTALPRITIRYSPDRDLLADGKDQVAIDAFLLSDAVARDIRLNVFDGSGTMQPVPMLIAQGQIQGHSVLTSSHPGNVTVEFLGSAPNAQFEGEKKLNIRFTPPVTRLDLEASPPAISLVDTADVVARLCDERGLSIATDVPRQVTFTIESGQGGIRQKDVTIRPGQFEARTTFQPEWPGNVKVAASTANLMTATAPLSVATPVALLICSGLGGIIGGILSRRKGRKPNRWRPLIGLATGFLFYWGCIFLGMAALARGVVLNPISALALSAIGGWLQTEVFTVLWSGVKPKAGA
jgi:hypothetical protein